MCGALLLLTGCLPIQGRSAEPELERAAEVAFDVYRDCMADASARLAVADATAFEVSAAAQGSCSGAFALLRRANRDHITSLVSDRNREMAVRKADQASEQQRQAVSGWVVEYVVEGRAPR